MSPSGLDMELRKVADSTAESISSAAREEAERIESEAAEQIERRRGALIRDKEAEYGAEARTAIAAARQEALQSTLVAQTALVERVLERAKALLPQLSKSEAYLSELTRNLNEALQFVQGQATIVRCSPSLEEAVRDALRGRPNVTIEIAANDGTGFVLIGAEGSVTVDGRLESRIDRLAPSLAIEIHRRLGKP